eukprot:30999-Pelagococcus_subviridis.AAC.2
MKSNFNGSPWSSFRIHSRRARVVFVASKMATRPLSKPLCSKHDATSDWNKKSIMSLSAARANSAIRRRETKRHMNN